MSAEVLEAVVDRFLAVWGEPDPAVIRDELDQLCHHELSYHNPVISLAGTGDLAGHVSELAGLIGTRRLSRTTGLQLAGTWCRYGWALLPTVPGADLAGQTTLQFDAGQRIRSVVSFHGDLPARTYLVGL